ncbi:MAG: phosphoribosylglycinamide formyltransferase [Myxococcales bacterium]|nr:phosphoribosylglycinamide formyltransferase [Myxococcales bacterium]
MRPFKLAVLASGRGTLLPALVELCAAEPSRFELACLVVNVPDAPVRALATQLTPTCPQLVLPHRDYPDRAAYETAMLAAMAPYRPNLVVLAGFRRLLTSTFLDGIACPTINVHPSLLPAFPGMDAPAQALAAGVPTTGCTVHFVDAGMDTGAPIASRHVAIEPGDTPDSLHRRIAAQEAPLLCEVITRLAAAT